MLYSMVAIISNQLAVCYFDPSSLCYIGALSHYQVSYCGVLQNNVEFLFSIKKNAVQIVSLFFFMKIE